MEMGTVAVCEGSHKLPGFKKFQDTYGEFDTEAQDGYEGTGWFTEAQCSKIRKKCNFKSTETHFLKFQK